MPDAGQAGAAPWPSLAGGGSGGFGPGSDRAGAGPGDGPQGGVAGPLITWNDFYSECLTWME